MTPDAPSIIRYVLIRSDGREHAAFWGDRAQAIAVAKQLGCTVRETVFTASSSTIVWTPDEGPAETGSRDA